MLPFENLGDPADAGYVDGYRRVNRLFARRLLPLLRPDDIVWVHDYHLIPLAAELRVLGSRHRIGFFLHIPLPPPLILAAIPEHEWLMRSLFVGSGEHSEPQAERLIEINRDGEILRRVNVTGTLSRGLATDVLNVW